MRGKIMKWRWDYKDYMWWMKMWGRMEDTRQSEELILQGIDITSDET